jgi:hypothetical protein
MLAMEYALRRPDDVASLAGRSVDHERLTRAIRIA